MTYLVHILDDGNFELIDKDFLGLYPDLNPDELVELSDEQYQDFCAKDNGKTRFIEGGFVFYAPEEEDESKQLEQLRAALIRRIAEKTDSIKSQILVGYPQAEIDSFYRQEHEAREWVADNTKPTPMLSAIAENRGVPLDLLAQKVIEKAEQVAVVMGHIIGTRQAFEDKISLAKNSAELTACEEEIEQWQLQNL